LQGGQAGLRVRAGHLPDVFRLELAMLHDATRPTGTLPAYGTSARNDKLPPGSPRAQRPGRPGVRGLTHPSSPAVSTRGLLPRCPGQPSSSPRAPAAAGVFRPVTHRIPDDRDDLDSRPPGTREVPRPAVPRPAVLVMLEVQHDPGDDPPERFGL